MKPYSVDLRQRVVDAYAEGTIDQLAVRFSVSPSSVERWVYRQKATGSVAPTPNPAGKANAIVTEEDKALLVGFYREHPDATYEELAERFGRETGRPIARSTMGASIKRLEITRKKRASNPRSASRKK
jgi:transposase